MIGYKCFLPAKKYSASPAAPLPVLLGAVAPLALGLADVTGVWLCLCKACCPARGGMLLGAVR